MQKSHNFSLKGIQGTTIIMVRSALLAATALSIQSASAFVPAAPSLPPITALNLVPDQGRQLVAYSQDYLAKKARESASKASNLTPSRNRISADGTGPRSRGISAAARSFVSHILGYEEAKFRDSTSTSLSASSIAEDMNPFDDDVCFYPIVGFNLVDGHAVPTPDQQAACNLLPEGQDEEAFGYWSSSQGGGDSLWL